MTLREEVINLSEERKSKKQYLKKMDELEKAKKEADDEKSKYSYTDIFFGDDETSKKASDAYSASDKIERKIRKLEYNEPKYNPSYKRFNREFEKKTKQAIKSYNRNEPQKENNNVKVSFEPRNKKRVISYSEFFKGKNK